MGGGGDLKKWEWAPRTPPLDPPLNSLQIIKEFVFSHLTTIYPVACKIVGGANSWHPEGPAPNAIQLPHCVRGEKSLKRITILTKIGKHTGLNPSVLQYGSNDPLLPNSFLNVFRPTDVGWRSFVSSESNPVFPPSTLKLVLSVQYVDA